MRLVIELYQILVIMPPFMPLIKIMSPNRYANKYAIYTCQRRQIWMVLVLIIIGVLLDEVLGDHNIAKSVAVGAFLGYSAQSVFTYVAYRTTGVRQRYAIMLNMYLGQMLKWLITFIGFACIFIYMKSAHAFAVIISYVMMQLTHIVYMYKIK